MTVRIRVDDHEDKESPHRFDGTACIITTITTDKDGNPTNLVTALLGNASDEDLLVMLRYTLDKMQETLDTPELAAIDLIDHMIQMKEEMLSSGKNIQSGSDTIQ